MKETKYIYGPVPSRRLGISLGVSPIPKKTCNYSCIYCQLGKTTTMINNRKMFLPINDIIGEFNDVILKNIVFDVVTIVGEGEPTLYSGLGEIIENIKLRTDKPVAVITNGALLYDSQVRRELYKADIILPTMDAYDITSFKLINRPHKSITFEDVSKGLVEFSRNYKGQLWIEIMLIDNINSDENSLKEYSKILKNITFEKLYLNTLVRPPAKAGLKAVNNERMKYAADLLGGISIDLLVSEGFHSEIKDDFEAILSIIKRHPMNQHEIESFLQIRKCADIENILQRLKRDERVAIINFKGYDTYRLK